MLLKTCSNTNIRGMNRIVRTKATRFHGHIVLSVCCHFVCCCRSLLSHNLSFSSMSLSVPSQHSASTDHVTGDGKYLLLKDTEDNVNIRALALSVFNYK